MNDVELQSASIDEQALALCRHRHQLFAPRAQEACSDCRAITFWMRDMMAPRFITAPMVEESISIPGPSGETERYIPEGQGLIAFLVGALMGMAVGAIGITLARVWFW